MEVVVKRIIRKVLNGKCDEQIINELATLDEYCKRNNYTNAELKEAIPDIYMEGFENKDYQKLRKLIKKELLTKILDDSLTYLQVLRIIESLSVLDSEEEIKKKNNKIKFCLQYSKMACMYYAKLSDVFKSISLIK